MAFVLVLMLLMVCRVPANSQHDHLKQHSDKALRTYSSAMGAELYQKNDLLSEPVYNLIAERKLFYERYFQIGLHSELVSISTEFEPTAAIQLFRKRLPGARNGYPNRKTAFTGSRRLPCLQSLPFGCGDGRGCRS